MIIVSNKKNLIGDEDFMKEPLPIRLTNAIFAVFGFLDPPNNRKGSLT